MKIMRAFLRELQRLLELVRRTFFVIKFAALSANISLRARGPITPPDLSLTETFLAIIVGMIAIVPFSTWLYMSSTAARDQNRVQMLDMLVNQKNESELEDNRPLCVRGNGEQRTYVICENELARVATDHFENGRLAVRHFYEKDGTVYFAVDRYHYDSSPIPQLVGKERIIFRKVLFFFECGYLKDIFGPTGIRSRQQFDRFCTGEMAEIPPKSYFSSPPPFVLYLPYR